MNDSISKNISSKQTSPKKKAFPKKISKRLSRTFVNVFIIFHLIAFVLWSCPLNWWPRDQFVRWITPYMLWSGLWQGWDMFAPDPLRVNAHLEALITFRDGTQATWQFPRVEKYGYFDRYLKERYRKWSSSYIRLDAYASLWADTARYIARSNFNSSNPPIEIQLKRYWMEIPPPQLDSIYQPWSKEYRHDQSFTFFIYQPHAEDFS